MRMMMIKVFCSDISCERCVLAPFSHGWFLRAALNCHNKCRTKQMIFICSWEKKFGVSSVATAALLFSAYDDSSSAARALKPLFTTTDSAMYHLDIICLKCMKCRVGKSLQLSYHRIWIFQHTIWKKRKLKSINRNTYFFYLQKKNRFLFLTWKKIHCVTFSTAPSRDS